jgi:hypothetical protein
VFGALTHFWFHPCRHFGPNHQGSNPGKDEDENDKDETESKAKAGSKKRKRADEESEDEEEDEEEAEEVEDETKPKASGKDAKQDKQASTRQKTAHSRSALS